MAERGRHGACWDISRFVQGPVVGGECPGESTLPQCQDKVHQPQQHEQVTQLQNCHAAIIHTLTSIKRKHTPRTHTHTAHIPLTEHLQCSEHTHSHKRHTQTTQLFRISLILFNLEILFHIFILYMEESVVSIYVSCMMIGYYIQAVVAIVFVCMHVYLRVTGHVAVFTALLC